MFLDWEENEYVDNEANTHTIYYKDKVQRSAMAMESTNVKKTFFFLMTITIRGICLSEGASWLPWHWLFIRLCAKVIVEAEGFNADSL